MPALWMDGWIVPLLTALEVALCILAVWITVKAFEHSVLWGLIWISLPLVFRLLESSTGPVAAAAVLGIAPLRFAFLHRRGIGRVVLVAIGIMLLVSGLNRATFGTWPWR